MAEQQSNKRTNKFIEYGGQRKTISQWARYFGVGKETIQYRLSAGWSPEECLFGKEKKVGNSAKRIAIPSELKAEKDEQSK